MKLRKRILYIIIFLFCNAFQLLTGDVSFTVQIPQKQINIDRNFQVIYKITNWEIDSFKVVPIKGLKIISGPSKSFSQEIKCTNGKTIKNITTYFTVTYKALNTGIIKIPPVTINIDGKDFTTENSEIKVLGTKNPKKKSKKNNSKAKPAKKDKYKFFDVSFNQITPLIKIASNFNDIIIQFYNKENKR